jgi:hypothetical protein
MRSRRHSAFSHLKIALVADELTRVCLSHECRVMNVTPSNSAFVFNVWRPDLLFVESCWEGVRNAWRYKIASYADHPERNNMALQRLVERARAKGVPAIFWNREDGVHFDRFIDSARLFDAILTVDATTIPHYRQRVAARVPVSVMMFAAQPVLHHPADVEPIRRASFVGSYSTTVHPRRRLWQDAMFDAAEAIGLTVFDRNSARRPDVYRFPQRPWIDIRNAIPHRATADVFRNFIANLNVNTMEESPTAFSRRLVEILACGGLAVTNPTVAVERLFPDCCFVARDGAEARDLFARLARDGLSRRDREMMGAGVDAVRRAHTWAHRLEQIASVMR